jgi:alcohol dehydrogenase (cytochrome c)
VISISGKDGLLRLLDRESQEQFYEVPITTRENVDALPTVEGVHRCPGLLGGMEWNGPAYDPASNALFVPAVDWCGTFSKAQKDPPIMQGMHYYGGAVASDPREKSKGWLTAFDASTGKELWKYASPTPLVAGVTATLGGVLFTGDLNNDFLALDAKTGDVLYRFNTGGSIGGGVITYALDGKQYVAATSGTVSAFFGGSGLPAVVVFAEGPRIVQTALKPLDPDQAPVAAGPFQREGGSSAGAYGRQQNSGPQRAGRFRHRPIHHARAVADHGQARALLQFRCARHGVGAGLCALS